MNTAFANTRFAIASVGALGGYIWSQQMAKKKAAMEQATAGTGVDVTQTADNQLKLNIPCDISFDTGRSDIKPKLRPILDQFAQGLGSQPNTEVRIIGRPTVIFSAPSLRAAPTLCTLLLACNCFHVKMKT